MIPTIIIRGAREAHTLLTGIAERLDDTSPAWDAVGDDVLQIQRRWWLTGGDWGAPSEATRERDRRGGERRDPRMMVATGATEASLTRRGARGQILDSGRDFFLLGTTLKQAEIQASLGRDPLKTPTSRDVNRYARRVLRYVLTGSP